MREGRSPLPMTPEDTPEPDDSSDHEGLPVMEEEEEVPSASTAKGKETLVEHAPSAARIRVAPASAAGTASLGGGTSSRGPSGSGGAQPPNPSKKRKRQASVQR